MVDGWSEKRSGGMGGRGRRGGEVSRGRTYRETIEAKTGLSCSYCRAARGIECRKRPYSGGGSLLVVTGVALLDVSHSSCVYFVSFYVFPLVFVPLSWRNRRGGEVYARPEANSRRLRRCSARARCVRRAKSGQLPLFRLRGSLYAAPVYVVVVVLVLVVGDRKSVV